MNAINSRPEGRGRARKTASIVLTAAVVGLVLGGMAGGSDRKIIGVAGGDNYLYRVYDDGSVDFLQVNSQIKSVRGIPGWQPIQIDPDLRGPNR